MLHLHQRHGNPNTANSLWAVPRVQSPVWDHTHQKCNTHLSQKPWVCRKLEVNGHWWISPGKPAWIWKQEEFFYAAHSAGGEKLLPPPGQQGCLAVAARQQRWAHVECQRFYKRQKGGWRREGWGGMETVALHSHSEYSSVCSSFCLEPARSRFFPQVLVLFMITEVMWTVTENGLLNPTAVGLLSCSVSAG